MRLRELCALLALVTFETRERGLDEMVQFVLGGGTCRKGAIGPKLFTFFGCISVLGLPLG